MRANSDKGTVVIYAILILGAILTIVLSLTAVFVPKLKSVTEAVNSVTAVFAADSAIEWCLYEARSKQPATLTMLNGANFEVTDMETNSRYKNPGDCTVFGDSFQFRAKGDFRSISRAFEVVY